MKTLIPRLVEFIEYAQSCLSSDKFCVYFPELGRHMTMNDLSDYDCLDQVMAFGGETSPKKSVIYDVHEIVGEYAASRKRMGMGVPAIVLKAHTVYGNNEVLYHFTDQDIEILVADRSF